MAQVSLVGDEETAAVQEETVVEAPWRQQITGLQARRMSSMNAKEGPERMHAAPRLLSSSTAPSVSWRDKASATMLRHPRRYSTAKSKPNSLLIHWCCGTVDKRWSNRNFKL